jgi:hypothetical protein
MHQVVALHVGGGGRRQRDGAGVVDADVERAERLHRLGNGRLNLVLEADVAGDGKRLAAGLLDLLGSRKDRAFQLGVRLGGLGGDGDVGAVARGPERDGEADAATGTRDEQRFPLGTSRSSRSRLSFPFGIGGRLSQVACARSGGCGDYDGSCRHISDREILAGLTSGCEIWLGIRAAPAASGDAERFAKWWFGAQHLDVVRLWAGSHPLRAVSRQLGHPAADADGRTTTTSGWKRSGERKDILGGQGGRYRRAQPPSSVGAG